MTPQDVVSLAPPRGFLTLIALVLTAMASCFWTCESDVEAELEGGGRAFEALSIGGICYQKRSALGGQCRRIATHAEGRTEQRKIGPANNRFDNCRCRPTAQIGNRGSAQSNQRGKCANQPMTNEQEHRSYRQARRCDEDRNKPPAPPVQRA